MDKVTIVENFISEEDCNKIIVKLNTMREEGSLIKRDDGRIGLINSKDPEMLEIVEKYRYKVANYFDNGYSKLSGYIATIYDKGIGMYKHVDPQNEYGALLYLNDNYEGGEIFADIHEEYFTHKPKKGDLVYFMSYHPHGVNKVIKGTRYFFTISLVKEENV